MKSLKLILLNSLILMIITSCKKSEQRKFVEEISGTYSITSITLSKKDLVTDSITLNNAGEFFFDNCKIDGNKSRGFCEGYYIYNNEPKYEFGYNLANETGIENLLIQPNNSPMPTTELRLLGAYEFTEKTGDVLKLSSTSSSLSVNRTRVKVRMTLTRK